MKRFLVGLVALLVAGSALSAETSLRFSRSTEEFKYEGRPYWMQIVNAAGADTDAIYPVKIVGTSAGSITFSAAQQAVFAALGGGARNLTVNFADYTGGNNAGVPNAGTCIITGTNLSDETITETFTSTSDTGETKTGAYAFKTIVSAAITAGDDAGYYVSIGNGSKIGIPATLNAVTQVMIADANGTAGTATTAVDNDEIEKNTIVLDTVPNGSVDFTYLFWISPYASLTTATRGW